MYNNTREQRALDWCLCIPEPCNMSLDMRDDVKYIDDEENGVSDAEIPGGP